MTSIGLYCKENELIINIKKDKTELILFGTAKRLQTAGKRFEITCKGSPIHFITKHKSLGIIIDNALPMLENFDRNYKYASSLLRLLD